MSLYERIHGRRPDPRIASERAAYVLATKYDKAVALGDILAAYLLGRRIVRTGL